MNYLMKNWRSIYKNKQGKILCYNFKNNDSKIIIKDSIKNHRENSWKMEKNNKNGAIRVFKEVKVDDFGFNSGTIFYSK